MCEPGSLALVKTPQSGLNAARTWLSCQLGLYWDPHPLFLTRTTFQHPRFSVPAARLQLWWPPVLVLFLSPIASGWNLCLCPHSGSLLSMLKVDNGPHYQPHGTVSCGQGECWNWVILGSSSLALGEMLACATLWQAASPLGSTILYFCQGFFLPRCRTLHLSSLNFIRLLLAHSSNLARSLWMAALPFSFIIYVCKTFTYIYINASHCSTFQSIKMVFKYVTLHDCILFYKNYNVNEILYNYCAVYCLWHVENNSPNL